MVHHGSTMQQVQMTCICSSKRTRQDQNTLHLNTYAIKFQLYINHSTLFQKSCHSMWFIIVQKKSECCSNRMHVKTRSSAKVIELLQFCTPLQSYVTRERHALHRRCLECKRVLTTAVAIYCSMMIMICLEVC